MDAQITSLSPEAALAERYGAPMPTPAVWNEVIASMLDHRSVRSFLPDGLAPGTLETLVAAAQSAPSSSNMQVWSVVAVEDQARKARLAAMVGNQKHVAECPLLLVWLADLSRAARIGIANDQPLEALSYTETMLVGVIDAALAAQNALVAAESAGLGTVYIGAIRNKPAEVAAELGLPPQVVAVFGLCVGHPDPAGATGIKPRLPQSVVLHRETYQAGVQESADIAAYDGYMQDFQKKQGMQPADWSLQISQRIATKGGLNGRERLRTALESFGFLLK
jgi:nitroreductase